MCYSVKPAEKLQLIGVKSEYHVGDLVKISCVSAASKPAAILAWFVNGNRVSTLDGRLQLLFFMIAILVTDLSVGAEFKPLVDSHGQRAGRTQCLHHEYQFLHYK